MSLEPYARAAAITMVTAARQQGIPLIVISGRRTAAQNAAVGGAPGSRHLDGTAFDVAIHGLSREQVAYWWWEALGTWAEQNLGLSWGGRFVHNGAPDVNHFDLRGLYT
ncbi:MAG TPA: D-Ala-D-Ala carboxypeptidase family metallohydrolase [Burkholderiales bacterium]